MRLDVSPLYILWCTDPVCPVFHPKNFKKYAFTKYSTWKTLKEISLWEFILDLNLMMERCKCTLDEEIPSVCTHLILSTAQRLHLSLKEWMMNLLISVMWMIRAWAWRVLTSNQNSIAYDCVLIMAWFSEMGGGHQNSPEGVGETVFKLHIQPINM